MERGKWEVISAKEGADERISVLAVNTVANHQETNIGCWEMFKAP
jgi:hypothetical protein